MSEPTLHRVVLTLCSSCIDGEGQQCHTPGCALIRNRCPDFPVRDSCDVESIDGFPFDYGTMKRGTALDASTQIDAAAEEYDPGHVLRVNEDLRRENVRLQSHVPGLSAEIDGLRYERDLLLTLIKHAFEHGLPDGQMDPVLLPALVEGLVESERQLKEERDELRKATKIARGAVVALAERMRSDGSCCEAGGGPYYARRVDELLATYFPAREAGRG